MEYSRMNKNDIFSILIKHIHTFIRELDDEIPEITSDTYFTSFGANSCDRAVIASDIIDEIPMKTPLEELLEASTVGEMVELLYSGQIASFSNTFESAVVSTAEVFS